jgi:hypothetical protein
VTGCRQLLLTVMQQALQVPDSFCARGELPLGNSSFLLQLAVLLDELSLHNCQLFQVSLEESHLLLLGAVVARSEDVVVLFSGLIERDLELDNLDIYVSMHMLSEAGNDGSIPSRSGSVNLSSSSSS